MIRKPKYINPRGGDEYKEFCRLVRKRDGNKCQMPGCNRRTTIQVHHILRYADSGYGKLNPSNALCLCKTHHTQVTGSEQTYAALFIRIVGENTEKQNKKNNK